MILYVPFTRKKAGDLVSLVERWKKNHLRNSKQGIQIIYHGDDLDLLDDMYSWKDKTEIYVCAHGFFDEDSLVVGNHYNIIDADLMTIKMVAHRFNHDFLFIASQISAIHLYCCGSKKKNMEIARQFHSNLLRHELPIYSYTGSITIADNNGLRWSFVADQATPIEQSVNVCFNHEESLDEMKPHRTPVKEATKAKNREETVKKRHDAFFMHQKDAKNLALDLHREKHLSFKYMGSKEKLAINIL